MEIVQYIGYSIYLITIIGTILVVISENRNPIRTLAWVLVLIFIPAIGIVLFYFFGQNNRKIRSISSKYKEWKGIRHSEALIAEHKSNKPKQFISLSKLLSQVNDSLLLRGSKVEIITSGPRKFEALLSDIEKATHHIHMEYFIFNNDETGRKVKQALMKKASEGVSVRFLYDNVANIGIPAGFYNEMKKAGVEVCPFMKIRFASFKSRVNYRNHRKVVVIDGTIGYIGGMNIGDEYAANPNWRDTHLRIQGRGVYALQINFLKDWFSTLQKEVGSDDGSYFPDCDIYTDNLLQVAVGGPNTQWPNLLQATISAVISSKKYLYIQTPYFLPTDSLFEALQIAALSGVDVQLMVSRKSDSSYLDPAIRSYYSDLLRSGLRIFEHQTQFIHAKTMVADDYLSVIGSANMDFRSFESNFEINCYLYDQELAIQNKEIFLKDREGCKEVLLEEWEKRSRLKRVFESLMRLFAPLM
ncbi:MAG: cardiolipin synthase [Tannerella sp.]|jgi:cardiolipin synthase|nr:cardiolipin synthase [Tannerella sp.]